MFDYKQQKGNALVIGIVIVALIVIGGYFMYQQNQSTTSEDTMIEDDSMTQDDSMSDEAMMPASPSQGGEQDAMQEDDSMMEDDTMMEEDTMQDDAMQDDSMSAAPGSYEDYSPEAFAAAAGKTRVYFFHAKWCPTCTVANIDFNNNESDLPDDVVVFKTDYDTETELKERYGITYQHTFVQVDAEGNEVAKWNGGGVDEVVENVKL